MIGSSECKSRTLPNDSCKRRDSSLENLWLSPFLWSEDFVGRKKEITSYWLHRTHLLHCHAVSFHFYEYKLLRFLCGPMVEEVALREPELDWGKQTACGWSGPALLLCLKFLRWAVPSSFHLSIIRVKGPWHTLTSIISSEYLSICRELHKEKEEDQTS